MTIIELRALTSSEIEDIEGQLREIEQTKIYLTNILQQKIDSLVLIDSMIEGET
ncbi:MAG: hypothetical protein ACOX8Q_06335 [Christensenellales bacterium]|jgi:hypothetical protein